MDKLPPYLLPFTRSRLFASLVDNQLLLNIITLGQHTCLVNRVLKALAIIKSKQESIRILQVGVVPGVLTTKIAKLIGGKGEIVIIDPLPFQLERAKNKLSKFENIQFIQATGEDIPYADKSFDVMVIFFLFHELPHSIHQKIINEGLRLLDNNGRIIICDFSKPSSILGKILVFLFATFGEKYLYLFINTPIKNLLSGPTTYDIEQDFFLSRAFQFVTIKKPF